MESSKVQITQERFDEVVIRGDGLNLLFSSKRALASVGHAPETPPISNYEEDREHERAGHTSESGHQDRRQA